MIDNKKPVQVVEVAGDFGVFVKKNSNTALKIARLESCYGITIASDNYNFAYHLNNPILGKNKEDKKRFVKSIVSSYFKNLPDADLTKNLKVTTLIQDENYQDYLNNTPPDDERRNLTPKEFIETLQEAIEENIKARQINYKFDSYFQTIPDPDYNRYHLVIDENGNNFPYISKSDKMPQSYNIYYHGSERKKALKPDYYNSLGELQEIQKKAIEEGFYRDLPDNLSVKEMEKYVLFYTPQQLSQMQVPKTVKQGNGEYDGLTSREYSAMLDKKAKGAAVLWKSLSAKPRVKLPPIRTTARDAPVNRDVHVGTVQARATPVGTVKSMAASVKVRAPAPVPTDRSNRTSQVTLPPIQTSLSANSAANSNLSKMSKAVQFGERQKNERGPGDNKLPQI